MLWKREELKTVQARQWVAELKMFKFSLAVIGAKEIRNEYTTGAA